MSTKNPYPEVGAPDTQASLVIEAIYADGVIRPLLPINLPPGTPLQLQIVADHEVVQPTSTATPGESAVSSQAPRARRPRARIYGDASSVGGALPAPEQPGTPVIPDTAGRTDRRLRLGKRIFAVLSLATVVLALFLRFFQLDALPGELYGDIAIVYEYVDGLLQGRFQTSFVLSAGPLYHYLIAPIAAVGGLSYLTLKVASVLVSLAVLGGVYALGRELLDDTLAILATFVAAVSSWLLIFSRLGNSQILVPLLAVGTVLFAVRLARRGQRGDVIACALVAALGLYTYPQSFVFPPVMFLTLLALMIMGTQVQRRHLLVFATTTAICAVPFLLIVARDPANFFTGYIGGKLSTTEAAPRILVETFTRALLALHIKGDSVFRSNPASLPHLDPISGLLFLGGLVFWLLPKRRRLAPALLLPLILFQIPSMLVLSNPDEVPSASRTLAIAPIAYLLAASGLWWGLSLLPATRWRQGLGLVGAGVVLALILQSNTHRYMTVYADGLPNNNVPFGRKVAEYLDTLPPETEIYLVGCCWGDAGQPEPKGISYVMRRPERFHEIERAAITCDWLGQVSPAAILVWNPYDRLPAPQVEQCSAALDVKLHSTDRGGPVFHSAEVLSSR